VDLAGQWLRDYVRCSVVVARSLRQRFPATNLKTVLIQISVLGIVAVGQTMVLLVRSIDLS